MRSRDFVADDIGGTERLRGDAVFFFFFSCQLSSAVVFRIAADTKQRENIKKKEHNYQI